MEGTSEKHPVHDRHGTEVANARAAQMEWLGGVESPQNKCKIEGGLEQLPGAFVTVPKLPKKRRARGS